MWFESEEGIQEVRVCGGLKEPFAQFCEVVGMGSAKGEGDTQCGATDLAVAMHPRR